MYSWCSNFPSAITFFTWRTSVCILFKSPKILLIQEVLFLLLYSWKIFLLNKGFWIDFFFFLSTFKFGLPLFSGFLNHSQWEIYIHFNNYSSLYNVMFFFGCFPDLFFSFDFQQFDHYVSGCSFINIYLYGVHWCLGSLYLYLINFEKMSAIISSHIFPDIFRVKVTKRRKRKSEAVLAILYMLIWILSTWIRTCRKFI